MDWSATDLDAAMRKFLRACRLHFDGPLRDVDEAVKVTYLKLWSGTEGQDIADTFLIPEDKKDMLQPWFDHFTNYVKPRSNFRVARFRLLGSSQRPDEPADSFLKRLKELIAQCDYTAIEQDAILVDIFIFGLHLKSVQSTLLKEGKELTVNDALRVARTEEATREQLTIIRGPRDEKAVHHVKQQRTTRKATAETFRRNPVPQDKCGNCGRQHIRGKCPARGQTCNACGKTGHWRTVCRSNNAQGKSTSPRKHHEKRIHEVQEHVSSEPHELLFDNIIVHTMSSPAHDQATQAFISITASTLQGQQQQLRCKIDTGSEGNVMPLDTYKRLTRSASNRPTGLTPSATRIMAYGGTSLANHGTCKLTLSHGSETTTASFYVTSAKGPVLLGLPTCRALRLISLNFDIKLNEAASSVAASSWSTNIRPDRPKGDAQAREQILCEFADVFEGIGCFEGTCRITVDPTVQPVVHPPRRIPVSLREKLKAELDSLAHQGILSPVTHPTDWVNSCVCVTKSNGKIRLCLDPRDLNKAIKRPHYVTPTLEDVLSRLHGAKWFSILDARSGYWNLRLDEASADLTTFNTPFGRFRFNRLPFGISCAQDEFQRAIDNTFGDIPNVLGIADDLVVIGFAEDGSDHDASLRAVLERARQRGPKLNEDKLIVRAREIPFFGHLVGSDGVRPDPSKVKAITGMEAPSDVKQLQSFLGMVNYINRFSPRLANLTAPLRDLLKHDAEFIWGPEHEKAFQATKAEIGKSTVLRYYNPSRPLIVQVDASGSGLGAALIQEDGPIAFASKSLVGAETRYSNIEREMLAVIFGLERFHHYVYGRPVIVHSDHKPLEAISLKNLSNAPPRLARMLLRAQCYDFRITYRPGKQITVADALSRVSPFPGPEISGINVAVHHVDTYLHATPTCLADVRRETAADPTLSAVVEAVTHGWPLQRSSCPSVLSPFWNYREELGVQEGLLLKGSRIVVPDSMKPRILAQLHAAHQGMEKTKLLARSSIFWVGLNYDIEKMVSNCATCQRHLPAQQREPLLPHDVAPRAWHTVAADLFHWEDKTFLLVGDTYSRFPIVRKLTCISSKGVIIHLRGIFDEYGIPERLMTDNGPQFAAREFRDFSKEYGFEHTTSSPHYPRSNGFIERLVQTIKRIFTKCREGKSDPHLALLNYRATPLSSNLLSPAELLAGRRYKTILLSRPSPGNPDTRQTLAEIKENAAHLHDRQARALPPLTNGCKVLVRNASNQIWEPAEVINSSSQPRSYELQTHQGRVRRNRRDIRPLPRNQQTPREPQETSQSSAPREPREAPSDAAASSPSLPLEPTSYSQPACPATEATGEVEVRRSSRRTKPPERYGYSAPQA